MSFYRSDTVSIGTSNLEALILYLVFSSPPHLLDIEKNSVRLGYPQLILPKSGFFFGPKRIIFSNPLIINKNFYPILMAY